MPTLHQRTTDSEQNDSSSVYRDGAGWLAAAIASGWATTLLLLIDITPLPALFLTINTCVATGTALGYAIWPHKEFWQRFVLPIGSGSALSAAVVTTGLLDNLPLEALALPRMLLSGALLLIALTLLAPSLGSRAQLACLSAVSGTLGGTIGLLLLTAQSTSLNALRFPDRSFLLLALLGLFVLTGALTVAATVRIDRMRQRSPLRWAPWAALGVGLLLTTVSVSVLEHWQTTVLQTQTRTEAVAAANHAATLLDNRLQRLDPERVLRLGIDEQSVPGLLWYGPRAPFATRPLFVAPEWRTREEELRRLVQSRAPLDPALDSPALLSLPGPDGRPLLLVSWHDRVPAMVAVIDPTTFFAPTIQAAVARGVAIALMLDDEPLVASGLPAAGVPAEAASVASRETRFGILRVRVQLAPERARGVATPFPIAIGVLGVLATSFLTFALVLGWRMSEANRQLYRLSQQLSEEIDERKTIERILAEREARLQAMLRQLPAIVWTVDRDLVFTSSEGSGLQQLGLQPGQVVGQTLFEYFGTEDPDYLPIQLHRRALAGEPQEYEFDTNGRHYRVRLEPLRDSRGEIVGVVGIAFDVTEQVRAQQELERMATTDPLTGLANRAALIARLEELERVARPFAVFLIDLDGFKAVNDTFGHLAGDAILRAVAERLRHTVRSGDMVGRLGGDEFLVVAPVQNQEAARELARRLLVALSQPLSIEDRTVSLGGSIGVFFCADGACPARDVLRDADLALYEAKRRGKGRIVFFEPVLAEEATHELTLGQALREAFEREAIGFRGFPIVHLQNGQLFGIELIPFWIDPQGTEHRAESLARTAERAGIDVALAQRVVAEAIGWLSELPESWAVVLGFPSPALLDQAVTDYLAEQLASRPAHGGRLWLDLPASVVATPGTRDRLASLGRYQIGVLVRDPILTPEGIDPLVDLHRAGIRIPDGFVRSFLVDPRAATLARALVQVARDLTAISLADSIEEFAVYVALARSGCTLGRGPLFGGELDRQRAVAIAPRVSHWRQLVAELAETESMTVQHAASGQDGQR